MTVWALRDAQRVILRVRHTVKDGRVHRDLTAAENSYLRGQIMHLLIGPLDDELPPVYGECLRDLLACLEALAAEHDEADR